MPVIQILTSMYTPWNWHLLQEKLWRKGQKQVLKCHYSATVFVVPDQILQVDSDFMEKYCNSEKMLHATFGQQCLPGTKHFQGPGNWTSGGQPYLSIRTKCIGDYYPLLWPGFHVNKCPAKWPGRNWRYKLHPGLRSLWKGQNEHSAPALQLDANFQFI